MDTAPYREKLEEEKKRLESEMASVGRPNPEVPGDWEAVPSSVGAEPDPIDQAEAITSTEENAAILADLEARYGHVREALLRMDSSAYGLCDVCGESIEAERLRADPAATTCKKHL